MKFRGCTCGFRMTRTCHIEKSGVEPKKGANGFSLLEVVFSLGLAAVVLTTSLHLTVVLLNGTNHWLGVLETSFMSSNVQRVLAQDVHRAATTTVLSNQLVLTTLDGTTFRYMVNSSGQFVRVQTGGGTAVIAEGIREVVVTAQPSYVQFEVKYGSGRKQNLIYSTPEALVAW